MFLCANVFVVIYVTLVCLHFMQFQTASHEAGSGMNECVCVFMGVCVKEEGEIVDFICLCRLQLHNICSFFGVFLLPDASF